MDELTYDYIHGSTVSLYQRKDMFRINTDTALLANFMKIKASDTVLDIGTNNGALLLMAATFHPQHLYGVDIQEEAIELASYNMAHHGIENVTLLTGDICELTLPKVNVVVCNPPYFKVEANSNVNESPSLQMARHETYLTFDTLCEKVSKVLDEKGRFYFVHRANRFRELTSILAMNRLETRTIQFIYDRNKHEAVGVLVEAVKDGKVNAHVLEGIYVERDGWTLAT